MSTMQLPKPISVQVEPLYHEQIAEIVARVRQRYPREQISQAELDGRVRAFHRQFSAARIRTFVATFVERLVQRSIEKTSSVGVTPRCCGTSDGLIQALGGSSLGAPVVP
jgi:hypothetical protein